MTPKLNTDYTVWWRRSLHFYHKLFLKILKSRIFILFSKLSQVWWHTSVIPSTQKQKQEDYKFEAS
jgi:hypothetical protein